MVAPGSVKSVSPKTGDSAGFGLAAAAMSVVAAISAAFAALRRREGLAAGALRGHPALAAALCKRED